MSYDIYLRGKSSTCPTCDQPSPGPDDLPNPTYNLTPIFDRALTGEELPNPEVSEVQVVLFRADTERPRGLRLLSGVPAKDTVEWLRKAVWNVNDPANVEAFRALEPANKWGTLEVAREVLAKLLEAAEDFPEHIWEVQ